MAISAGSAALLAATALLVTTARRAENALDSDAALIREAEKIAYERSPLVRTPGLVEPLPANPDWRDVARFAGGIYLLGPASLSRYSTSGELERVYRAGAELPAAELVALAAGPDPRSGERRLFVAASGAGWLIVAPDGAIEQVRPKSVDARRVTALLPLDDGRLLLGTLRSGVFVDDGETLRPLHRDLMNLEVTALAGDIDDIWIGARNDGLHRLASGALSHIELADPQALSLAAAGDRVFVGGPVGVAEIRDGRLARSLADGFFAATLAVDGDRLWVGTLDEGVIRVPLEALRPGRAPAPPEQGPLPVRRLLVEESVLAVSPAGLYEKTEGGPSREAVAAPRDGLSARNVTALRLDSRGDLWIGYFDRGLDIAPDLGGAPLHVENDRVFCVNRIVEDETRKRMLVATANGLVAFDAAGRERETLRSDDGLLADHVTDVLPGQQGLTVATGAGLTFLDSSGARGLYAFHGLVNNHVYALAARDDRLLAGTLGGLSLLDGGVVARNWTTANSNLAHNWITAALTGPAGDWWIGTYGGGVQRIDRDGLWTSWPELDGVEINPHALLFTDGRVWAGALDGGLLVYSREIDRWTPWTKGLPSHNVTALERTDDMIVIGTDNGVVRAPLDLF